MPGAYDSGRQPTADKDPTQEIQWQIQRAVQGLWEGILGAINAAVNAVREWVQSLFGGLWHFLDDNLNIGDVIERILQALTGMSTGEVLELLLTNPIGFLPIIILNFIRNGLLGPHSPLNAFNIFGFLQSWNIPFLSIGALTDAQPNMLIQPGFTVEDSIGETENARGWVWDPDDGRTDPGCARVDVQAGVQQILQSVPIPTGENQKLKCSVWVKWQNLEYIGVDPIIMDLVRFDANGVEISKTSLESITNPAPSSGGNWFEITAPADYVVPAGDTSQVVLQFRVPENATQGSIWWDDASLKKTNTSIPQNWILNLIPDLGGIRDFIQDVVDAVISGIRGIPFVGGTLAALILDLTGWREDTDDAAAQAADAYIGLGVTQKIITSASTGATLDPSIITTPEDELVQAALQQQTDQIIQQSAAITALQANFEGVTQNGGISSGDLFEYVNTDGLDTTGLWDLEYLEGATANGVLAVADGHNAGMHNSLGGSATILARYSGPMNVTETNHQKVCAVVASQMVWPNPNFPYFDTRRSQTHLYMRMSEDKQTWVRWVWTNFCEIYLQYRIAGGTIQTLLGPVNVGTNPGPGGQLYGLAGQGLNDYVYSLMLGTRGIYAFVDSSELTMVGEDYRGFGWGQRYDNGAPVGLITQFNAYDNKPAPIPGNYIKVARFNSAGVVIPNSTIMSGVMDTVVAKSANPGVSFDMATGRFTCETAGIYSFHVRLREDSRIANSTSGVGMMCHVMNSGIETVLYNNITSSAVVGFNTSAVSSMALSGTNSIEGRWDVPMLVGDEVAFSTNDGGLAFTCTGTTDGGRTFITATKVG